MKKPRTWVKTFMPVMAPQVEARTKTNTIRPWPKREQDIPRAGQRISCREWTGRPYNSKQRILCEGRITEVLQIRIRLGCISLLSIHYSHRRAMRPRYRIVSSMYDIYTQRLFAKKDGFERLRDFRAWFLKNGATEFRGVFIKWEPDEPTAVPA